MLNVNFIFKSWCYKYTFINFFSQFYNKSAVMLKHFYIYDNI